MAHLLKEIVFDKYQKRAPDYHWLQVSRNIFDFNAYVAARYQQVVKTVPQTSQRILDIGCGDGVLLWLISQKTKAKLYSVDQDESSLEAARRKVRGKFIRAGAGKLPFKNNYFDVIIATELIEHLRKPEKLLQEAKRVLKSDGRLVVTTPVKLAGSLTDKLHVKEFSPNELKELCHAYFRRVVISTSHPLWFKKIYIRSFGQIGRYYLDWGRWLINLLILSSGWNPFISLPGKSTQQLAVCRE